MSKIEAEHLARRAYVDVRQSTVAQTVENVDSTKRQYELVDRAMSLGWPKERVEIIDEDLGKSGSSVAGRTGFARRRSVARCWPSEFRVWPVHLETGSNYWRCAQWLGWS